MFESVRVKLVILKVKGANLSFMEVEGPNWLFWN